ncbi:hypothetical protein HGRIS_010781 [Hohenbuehelia grisea]|uniref:N-acetyltransferase domain-containing protein n=1 Tax=Hohenbuehelia grisea TaxID=104357 RepID=A0ABR3IXR9_9AGAR
MESSTHSASHLGTVLRSPTFPILLRNIEPGDAETMSTLFSDPRNAEHDPAVSAMTVSVASSAIGRMRESAAVPSILSLPAGDVVSGPGRVNLVVVYVDSNTPEVEGVMIGFAGFGDIKTLQEGGKQVRVGDVGVMLNPDFRGKGYGVEAIKLSVEWGFRGILEGGLQLDRITATMRTGNTAMVGLVEKKLGWQATKRLGEGGQEELLYSVLPDAWK